MGAGKSRQTRNGVKPAMPTGYGAYSTPQAPYNNSPVPFQAQAYPGMYPMQAQQLPPPPLHCHQPVQPPYYLPSNIPPPHQQCFSPSGSMFPSNGFHMGPSQVRPLMPGYAANTENRHSSGLVDSSDNEDFKYYPQQQQLQKYRNL